MKWRVPLAVLLGLLLPVPLIWASSMLLSGGLSVPGARGDDSRVVPILTPEEARPLLTFQRPCRGNEDCDVPLVCMRGQLMFNAACVASECATDMDCREGYSCHSISAGERVVRLCGVTGQAKEGEFCMQMPVNQGMGCSPGLLCANKYCRRPCQSQESQSCPEGYFCGVAEDVQGPVCLPSCEGRSCPDGQRCVALEHGVSVCARVHGTDCQLNPCPAEQVCDVLTRESQGDAWMRCAPLCDKQASSCPEGFSCLGGRCRRRCSSDATGTCGPMETCVGFSERSLGVCIFDFNK